MASLAETFAKRLKAMRVAHGLSQGSVATAAGIARPSINRFEHGKQEPSWEQLERLCSALDCSLADLLGDPSLDDYALRAGADNLYQVDPIDRVALRDALDDAMRALARVRDLL